MPEWVQIVRGYGPERFRRGSKESQEMVQIECGEVLESLRRVCTERVTEGPERVRRYSKESGDGPMRVRTAPEKVRKGSREC